MFMLNGKPLPPDVAFRDADGVQYPANWLRCASAEDKARVGITEAPDPEPFDQRFYWGRDAEGNLLPKPVEQVKEMRVAEAKAQAAALLAQTDWEMVRALERAMAATLDAEGQALAAEREAIRSASNAAEAVVLQAEDVVVLAAVKVDVAAEAVASGEVRETTAEKLGVSRVTLP